VKQKKIEKMIQQQTVELQKVNIHKNKKIEQLEEMLKVENQATTLALKTKNELEVSLKTSMGAIQQLNTHLKKAIQRNVELKHRINALQNELSSVKKKLDADIANREKKKKRN